MYNTLHRPKSSEYDSAQTNATNGGRHCKCTGTRMHERTRTNSNSNGSRSQTLRAAARVMMRRTCMTLELEYPYYDVSIYIAAGGGGQIVLHACGGTRARLAVGANVTQTPTRWLAVCRRVEYECRILRDIRGGKHIAIAHDVLYVLRVCTLVAMDSIILHICPPSSSSSS